MAVPSPRKHEPVASAGQGAINSDQTSAEAAVPSDATSMAVGADLAPTLNHGTDAGLGLKGSVLEPGKVQAVMDKNGCVLLSNYFGREQFIQSEDALGLREGEPEAGEDPYGGEWTGIRGSLTPEQRRDLDEGFPVVFDDPGYFEEDATDGAAITNADGTEATLNGKPFVKVESWGAMPLEVLRAGAVTDLTIVVDGKTPGAMHLEWLGATSDEVSLRPLCDYFVGTGIREVDPGFRGLALVEGKRGPWYTTGADEFWDMRAIGSDGYIWFHSGPSAAHAGEKIEVFSGKWGGLVEPLNDSIHGLNLATALTMADFLAERGKARPLDTKVVSLASGTTVEFTALPEVYVGVAKITTEHGGMFVVLSKTEPMRTEMAQITDPGMAFRLGQVLTNLKVEDVAAYALRTTKEKLVKRVDEDLTTWDAGYGLGDAGVTISPVIRDRWLALTRAVQEAGVAMKDLGEATWRRESEAIPMVEIERRYDTTGINRHSVRVYEFDGERFSLDRTTDAAPPFFTAHNLNHAGGIAPVLQVDGLEFWGDGLSWRMAEAKLKATLVELRNQE